MNGNFWNVKNNLILETMDLHRKMYFRQGIPSHTSHMIYRKMLYPIRCMGSIPHVPHRQISDCYYVSLAFLPLSFRGSLLQRTLPVRQTHTRGTTSISSHCILCMSPVAENSALLQSAWSWWEPAKRTKFYRSLIIKWHRLSVNMFI